MEKALLDMLVKRLDNWGRWSRTGTGGAGTSPTYKVMRVLGYRPEYGAEAPRPVDERDALAVNAAVAALGPGPEQAILVAVYVKDYPDNHRACRFAGVRTRKFDYYLSRAHNRLISSLYCDTICSENSHAG